MPIIVEDLYEGTVSALPAVERLRLASLILQGLAPSETRPTLVDESDEWSTQDQADLAAFSLTYSNALFPEDEDLVECP